MQVPLFSVHDLIFSIEAKKRGLKQHYISIQTQTSSFVPARTGDLTASEEGNTT